MSDKKKDFELKIVKFIDYVYLNNFITNTLLKENKSTNTKNKYENCCCNNFHIDFNMNSINENDWKIFSNHFMDDNINILYFIKSIKLKSNYSYELLLLTIHIYTKICIKYAHFIENYTLLFASVYIAINKVMCDEYLPYTYLAKVLNVNRGLARKMVWMVDVFMDLNDIYFGSNDKERIIYGILYN